MVAPYTRDTACLTTEVDRVLNIVHSTRSDWINDETETADLDYVVKMGRAIGTLEGQFLGLAALIETCDPDSAHVARTLRQTVVSTMKYKPTAMVLVTLTGPIENTLTGYRRALNLA